MALKTTKKPKSQTTKKTAKRQLATRSQDTAQKNKGGRPNKWESVDDIQPLIDAFFKECDDKDDPYTITGLALALGTTRLGLINYEKKPGFVNAIKEAKARCENYAEKRLYSDRNSAGSIFALKNYGWSDKQEVTVDGTVEIKWQQ
jgi:hypothetical protein